MGQSNKFYNNIKTEDMIKLFLETYFYNETDEYKNILREVIYTEDALYVKKVIKSIFEFVGNSTPLKTKEQFLIEHTNYDFKNKLPLEWLEGIAVFLIENSI